MGVRLHLLVIIQNQHFSSAYTVDKLCQLLKSQLALNLDLGGGYLSVRIYEKKIIKLTIKFQGTLFSYFYGIKKL